MAKVELRGVEKAFGPVRVIHGIDVTIEDGSFAVLVGPSGCGKSTLLRMLAGLEDVTAGDVLIGDDVVNDLSPKERDIAMVFQNYGLYPHMTAAENMGFALKLQGVAKDEIRTRVERAADILSLGELLGRYPRQLSGGQRQRVAMGRAIVRDPVVFLFDEPLSNLDAKLRVQMRAEIKQLHQRLGTTTVYVTHDQIEAMTMADMIVVLNDGYVMQAGAPLDLYDRPANRFVAGFIGSPAMNFVEGRIESGAEGATFRDGNGAVVPLPGASEAGGGQVVLGLRPEDLVLAEDGLPLTIDVVEPTGAELHVNGRCGGKPLTAVFRERHRLRPGETIHVRPMGERYHLFDPQSEARLN